MTTHQNLLIASLVTAGLAAGCTNDDGPSGALTQQAAISDCGGFFNPQQKTPMGDPATYCDAEMLYWAYDGSTQTLSVANNRINLNCCGLHSMEASLVDGVYVLTETDAPEFGDARCSCMCVFDYTIDVQGIPLGTIPLRIERNVTDSQEGVQVVWQGTLDLATGDGSAILDSTDVEPWCSGAI